MSGKPKGALTVEDALARVLHDAAPLPRVEDCPLLQARNRILARDISARLTQPPFTASAMDGYAVRAVDLAIRPARLRVIGESAAGHAFAGAVSTGEAVRIFTGAPVPTNADAIVIQEDTTRDGDHVVITSAALDPEHIRPLGGDFGTGQNLLTAGARLTSRALLLAAAAGHATLPVRSRPRVAIIATGDELVLPGTQPAASQIVCSNPYGVATMLEAAGAAAEFIGIARDTKASLGEHLDCARDADIVITLGGASVGDHDLVGPVLRERGMALDFWKIAMRPGKPLMFGRLGAQRILGLPGNPVSSMVTARLFAVPLVEALLGITGTSAAQHSATTAIALDANGPRAHYMRATARTATDGTLSVTPVANQDSSLITPLAAADVLIVRPIGAPAVPAGHTVPILHLDF